MVECMHKHSSSIIDTKSLSGGMSIAFTEFSAHTAWATPVSHV